MQSPALTSIILNPIKPYQPTSWALVGNGDTQWVMMEDLPHGQEEYKNIAYMIVPVSSQCQVQAKFNIMKK